ncbi:chromosome segregation protein SMC [Pararhodospirillum oryzae]|uniref:Chromosome segregation protein SMC n=2 Tax=Pararhodospirillum oryzae TaxID=478448 RepID=A0A512H9L4_9PROT|nr:chromosome segregation protein SMC [Pararhodospirillum oryzae]
MFLHSLTLTNLLSFGPDPVTIDLRPLNVLIGPNGAGKSNLIEALQILKGCPTDLGATVLRLGGILDLLWKGEKGAEPPVASIEAVFDRPNGGAPLHYQLDMTALSQRFQIRKESVIEINNITGGEHPFFYAQNESGALFSNQDRSARYRINISNYDFSLSVLAQRKDPVLYPEITALGTTLKDISLYRDWSFGRAAASRLPQKTDLPNHRLDSDARNLGLILNRLRRERALWPRIMDRLRAFYEGIEEVDVQIEGGTVQVFFYERGMAIPATRLSDGTLRYLCLLAILCHPDPGPLVCLEEPELGLHPDILPDLADLLKEASRRTQLIVTTHSDILVSALSDTPESVLVTEHGENGTSFTRLEPEKLKPWLETYRLGQLWTRGDLGGTRW